MKITEKKIIEALPETPGTSFDFKGIYVDETGASHNLTVFDTEYFLTNVIQLYRNRKIVIDEDQENYLAGLFRIWRDSRKDLYLKQAYAYTIKYNPFDDYDIEEKLIDDITERARGTEKTDFHNTDTMTITPYTKETTETTPYTKETTETTPYTKETTETTPYTKETTETTPYTKETTETTPYTMETTETTPYTSETTKTTGITSGGVTPPNNKSTSSRKAFDSANWSEVEKTEDVINTQEELVKNGTEKVEFSKTGTEKVEFSKTGTEKVEFSKTGTEKVEFSKTGTEKVEFSKTGTEKVEHTKTGTETHADAHTGYIEKSQLEADQDTRNYTKTIKGHRGDHLEADILKAEYDLLIEDLAHRAMFEFIDRYTYYSEEVS